MLAVLSVTVTVAASVAFATVVPAITLDKAVPLTVTASASNVPSTSTSPDISKLVNTEVPTAVILSLNVAAPAADISNVNAVISLPPCFL